MLSMPPIVHAARAPPQAQGKDAGRAAGLFAGQSGPSQKKKFAMSEKQHYQVRPATARDVPAIAAIHISAWQAAYADLMPAEHLAQLSADKRQAMWREAIEFADPQVYVALDDATCVGFVAFDRSRDKGTPAETGEIWSLYVAPSRWSRGIGRLLWNAAHEGLKEEGCTEVTLWVLLGNARALAFYEKAGFVREPASVKTIKVGGASLEEIRLRHPID
jgi:ribosomal protein S18 acetylase RimI-like enzyme